MNLFNSVAELQKEGQDAISIFDKTVIKLNSVNEKISKAISTKRDKESKLALEIKALDEAALKNAKVAAKISDFLKE